MANKYTTLDREQARELQAYLRLWDPTLKVDGAVGPLTQKAFEGWCKDNGLPIAELPITAAHLQTLGDNISTSVKRHTNGAVLPDYIQFNARNTYEREVINPIFGADGNLLAMSEGRKAEAFAAAKVLEENAHPTANIVRGLEALQAPISMLTARMGFRVEPLMGAINALDYTNIAVRPRDAKPDGDTSLTTQLLAPLQNGAVFSQFSAKLEKLGYKDFSNVNEALAQVVKRYAHENHVLELNRAEAFALEASMDALSQKYTGASPIASVNGIFDEGKESGSDIVTKDFGQFLAQSSELNTLLEKTGMTVHYKPTLAEVEDGSRWGARNPLGGLISKYHKGLDYRSIKDAAGNATDTSVYASAMGRVRAFGDHPDFGNFIILEHPDKSTTLYAHLKEFPFSSENLPTQAAFDRRKDIFSSVTNASTDEPIATAVDAYNLGRRSRMFVMNGEYDDLSILEMPKGTELGIMGRTGRSTAIHLHYGYSKKPADIDALLDGLIIADWEIPLVAAESSVEEAHNKSPAPTPAAPQQRPKQEL